ncbi:MAG: phage holin family protein, partial [Acidobacteriota bacterium]
RNVGVVAAGGAVAYAGLLAIMAGIILIVSYAIPLWLASILVGGITAIGSYMAIASSLTELRNLDVTPTKSVDSLKEDAKWLKKQVS